MGLLNKGLKQVPSVLTRCMGVSPRVGVGGLCPSGQLDHSDNSTTVVIQLDRSNNSIVETTRPFGQLDGWEISTVLKEGAETVYIYYWLGAYGRAPRVCRNHTCLSFLRRGLPNFSQNFRNAAFIQNIRVKSVYCNGGRPFNQLSSCPKVELTERSSCLLQPMVFPTDELSDTHLMT